MADIEYNQQPQSVGVVADTVGASGSYSNSAVTMLRAGEPLPASRDDQIPAAKISHALQVIVSEMSFSEVCLDAVVNRRQRSPCGPRSNSHLVNTPRYQLTTASCIALQ